MKRTFVICIMFSVLVDDLRNAELLMMAECFDETP